MLSRKVTLFIHMLEYCSLSASSFLQNVLTYYAPSFARRVRFTAQWERETCDSNFPIQSQTAQLFKFLIAMLCANLLVGDLNFPVQNNHQVTERFFARC